MTPLSSVARVALAALLLSNPLADAFCTAEAQPMGPEIQPVRQSLRLAYLDLLDRYMVQSARAEAVHRLCAWSPADLDGLLQLLSDEAYTRTLARDRLRAALLLHADAAHCRSDRSLPAVLRGQLRVAWAVARTLHDSGDSVFVREWFLASSRPLLYEFPTDTAEHLTVAETLFAADPVVALTLGMTFELLASRHPVPRAAFGRGESPCSAGAHRKCLGAALKRYRRATTDPTVSLEAQLRLGRTEQLLGNAEAAQRTLRAVQLAGVPPYSYLATLFLAELAAGRGDTRAAEDLYDAALRMDSPPYAAAMLASALQERLGNLDKSLALLARALRPGARTGDPMLLYQTGRLTLHFPSVARLRERFER